jgi:hypothetical protein
MVRKTLFLRSFLALFSLALAHTSRGQDTSTQFELGAQYSTIRETNSALEGKNFSGFGGRFDWNLTRRLAFESQIDYFPENGLLLSLIQGGQTVQAVFGIRAKVIETRRFSVFGLVRPGLLHFSGVEVLAGGSSISYTMQPATYFVLNLGGGIEYYASSRWVLRAGALIENEPETNVPGKWEFGPLFSALMISREGIPDNVRNEPGVGGYASYRFYGVFYLDGDLLYFPRGTANSSSPQDGGTILQGLFGLKGGIRRNHFGFFGKVRPGFNSYSAALTSITNTGGAPTNAYGRSTNFVLDLGGIVELYPNERSTLRFEVGDTHLFFGTRDLTIDGETISVPGGKMQHSIQLMIGYGWRF